MHSRYAAYGGKIVHMHVTSQLDHIGDDAIAADLAIVRDMHIFHDQVVRAQHCIFLHLITAIDGYKFPNGVVVANSQPTRFSGIFQVLRVCPQDCEGKDLVSLSDAGMSIQYYVVVQDVVIPQDDVFTYHTVGSDLTVGTDFGSFFDDGCGMYLVHIFLFVIIAIKSPSATFSPFT